MSEGRSSLSNVGTFLLGALVGGLAGALAGVLVAPRSGAETQAEIRQRMKEFRDEAEKTIARSRESLEATITRAREEVGDGARTRLADGMERVGATMTQQARNIRPETIAK